MLDTPQDYVFYGGPISLFTRKPVVDRLGRVGLAECFAPGLLPTGALAPPRPTAALAEQRSD